MLELPRDIVHYLLAHTQPESPLLAELSRATHQQFLRPRMLTGHLQAQLIALLANLIDARLLLEIATFTGDSAIAIASSLPPDTRLHTIDNNDELEDFTRSYIQRAGLTDQIILHVGDALRVIPTLPSPLDLVYIDADKRQYPDYLRLVLPRLRPGGLLIADDVLWDGKVTLDAPAHPSPDTPGLDPQTRGILAFNRLVQDDPTLQNIILPLRHGLMIARKTKN